MTEKKYLIIGGATKAATTSLFEYLAAHPSISPSSRKETRFFLDTDYPLKSDSRFSDGLPEYDKYFHDNPQSIYRVEATPDYLFSKHTPETVRGFNLDVKWIFILREPVARIISWYNFSFERGFLKEPTSFASYLDEMKSADADGKQHLRALEQNHYAEYLTSYFDLFGKENVCVLFYEELVSDPASAMKEICQWTGIDVEFYRTYEFKKFNPSVKVKSQNLNQLYKFFRRRLRRMTHKIPFLHRPLKKINKQVEKAYSSVNIQQTEFQHIDELLIKTLRDSYRKSNEQLAALLDRKLPW